MSVRMVGLNHRTAALALRERLAMDGEKLARAYGRWRPRFPHVELVVLSTCNRSEFYIAGPAAAMPALADLTDFLCQCCEVGAPELAAALMQRDEDQAIHQLFAVAAGLDSMVLGEPQILGQVRRAYQQAQDQGLVGATLHQVFQQALAVAKRVRTETGIGEGRVSVGSVAVDFARQVFQHFADKVVVGIGAGAVAKLMLRHLRDLEPARLWIANRSIERARALADAIGITPQRGGPRPLEELESLLVEADVVLTATGSTLPIITAGRFRPLLRRRRHRPLFLIDIALPRDVEAAVGSLRNVFLYNLDDLQRVVAATNEHRQDHAREGQEIVAAAAAGCAAQLARVDQADVIRALRQKLHDLGRLEQERTARKLASAASEQLPHLLEEQTQRLVNKILHLPLAALDGRHPGPGSVPPAELVSALRCLFQLADAGHSAPAGEDRAGQSGGPAPLAEPAAGAGPGA